MGTNLLRQVNHKNKLSSWIYCRCCSIRRFLFSHDIFENCTYRRNNSETIVITFLVTQVIPAQTTILIFRNWMETRLKPWLIGNTSFSVTTIQAAARPQGGPQCYHNLRRIASYFLITIYDGKGLIYAITHSRNAFTSHTKYLNIYDIISTIC